MLYAARSKHLEGGVAAGEAGEIEAVLQELSPIACAPLIHVMGSKQCRQHNRTTQWPACNIHTMDLSGKCTCSCQRQYFFTVYNKSLNKEGRWRTKKSNARWAKACACVCHTHRQALQKPCYGPSMRYQKLTVNREHAQVRQSTGVMQ